MDHAIQKNLTNSIPGDKTQKIELSPRFESHPVALCHICYISADLNENAAFLQYFLSSVINQNV